MSNDRQIMKLYTENQVKMMLVRAKIFRGAVYDNFAFIMSEDEILNSETPIESKKFILPSEEIQKMAIERFPISMEDFGGEKIDGNEYFRSIFIQGIECLRDNIQGGNK